MDEIIIGIIAVLVIAAPPIFVIWVVLWGAPSSANLIDCDWDGDERKIS